MTTSHEDKMTTDFSLSQENRTHFDVIQEIGAHSSRIGTEATDIGAVLERLSQQFRHQSGVFDELRNTARQMATSNETVDQATQRAHKTALEASRSIERSRKAMAESLDEIRQLVDSVTNVEQQLSSLNEALQGVATVANEISTIAKQTNLLALNATIEATRAGPIGRGFAVVAEHVKELAKQTADATGDIHQILEELTAIIERLVRQGADSTQQAEAVREGAHGIQEIMEGVGSAMSDVDTESSRIQESVGTIDEHCRHTVDGLEELTTSVHQATSNLQDAEKHGRQLHENIQELSSSGEAADSSDGNQGAALAEVVQHAARQATKLSLDVMEITGKVDDTTRLAEREAELFDTLRTSTQTLSEANKLVDAAARNAQHVSGAAKADMQRSDETIRSALQRIRDLSQSVREIETDLGHLNDAMERVTKVARGIGAIAKQTHLLALNASIEAARAGEAGQGFGVVAEQVKTLAGQTGEATADVDRTLQELSDQTQQLIAVGHTSTERAELVEKATHSMQEVLDRITKAMGDVDTESARIAEAVQEIDHYSDTARDRLNERATEVEESKRLLQEGQERINRFLTFTEELANITNTTDAATDDTPYIECARRVADAIGKAFERALADSEIDMDALFDRDHQPVPGTDPQQYTTRYVEFTDRILPPIQEPPLEELPKMAGCCAIDSAGYIGTHNLHVTNPQRPGDPEWNARHARQRRMWMDRTAQAAARNTEPFLLQTYRRDMGGGAFEPMKDASAPISVHGKHWGAVRILYKA